MSDEDDLLTITYLWAFERGKDKAKARIEQLEAALRHCVNAIAEVEKCKPELLTYEMAFRLRPFLLGAMDNARAALAGEKKDE